MMPAFRTCNLLAVAAVQAWFPAVGNAFQFSVVSRNTNAPPTPSGTTPRTADGHPDLSGVWTGLGDKPIGIPNQMANAGIAVESASSTRDVASGARIATFGAARTSRSMMRRPNARRRSCAGWARTAPFTSLNTGILLSMTTRMLMKNTVQQLHARRHSPRGNSVLHRPESRLLHFHLSGGRLIATQTSYRMVPTDRRKHTPLQDLDGTYIESPSATREGDTLVVDSYGYNSSTWFDQIGGYIHSENMHVIERFHRDGNTLTWTATVEDPDMLGSPGPPPREWPCSIPIPRPCCPNRSRAASGI